MSHLRRTFPLALLIALVPWPAEAAGGGQGPLRARTAGERPAPLALDDGAGPSPRALVVDGEHDALRVPAHPDLAPGAAITLEAWVSREPALGCGTLIGSGRSNGTWLGICAGRLRFSPGDGSFVDGGALLPERVWTHVALTYDGMVRRTYINGVLDRESAEQPKALRAGPGGWAIGADTEHGAAFAGRIDNLRFWRVARPAADIARDLRQTLGAGPGLAAEWAMDGDARDRVGGHDGSAVNGGTFTYDGVLPRALDLPLSPAPVSVDGRCDPAEYGGSERLALDGYDRPKAYVQASADNLFVCLDNLPRAVTAGNALAAVYVDRDTSGEALPQPGDYRFSIRVRGQGEADEGDGKGGWRDLVLVPGEWQAAALVVDQQWRAEFRLPRRLTGARQDPDKAVTIGLALAYEEGRTPGDGIFWPAGARSGRTDSWAPATLAEVSGIAPLLTFEGQVLRLDAEGREQGIGGSELQLLAATEDALVLLDSAESDDAGRFRLSHRARGRPPQAYLLRQANARGDSSVAAEAGPDAQVAGPDLISYPLDPDLPLPGSFSPARFIDRPGAPPPVAGRQRYLVVYAPPVTEEDLWQLVAAKQAQGFRLSTVSTADLLRAGEGRDLAARIHHWLEAEWQAADDAPVYALLVGRGDKIPFRDVGWLDNDHRQIGSPGYFPAWPTDWYYADLDSDWDADGDGFHGEFMGCRPGDHFPDRDAPEGRRDCPEAGSLSREGPFGALRTAEDDFQAEIAVGRIALNQPGEVRAALAASVAAEAGGHDARRRALALGAFWSFAGSSWATDAGRYVSGGAAQADPWLSSAWNADKPFGQDAAEALETGLLPALAPFLSSLSRAYESAAPQGLESFGPSARQGDRPLSAVSVAEAWTQGYGLVAYEGNGSPEALVAAHWRHDWNGNFAIDQPARPSDCAGKEVLDGQIGPPCDELVTEALLQADLPLPTGAAPLVLANAGRTGEVAWTWDGVNEGGNVIGLRYGPPALAGALAGRGRAAAWVGALGAVEPGALDGFQTRFVSGLYADGLRAGDAFWRANSSLAHDRPHDLRSYGVAYFGDPAMSWWEGPPEAGAAWPADGGGDQAAGRSDQSGPLAPVLGWTSAGQGLQSPPVIGRDGDLLLAGTGRVLRYDSGGNTILASGPGTGGSTFAAALAADAVVLASGSEVQVLSRDLQLRERVALPGGVPVGAPRVASDGALWLPTSTGMLRISGGRSQRVGPAGAVAGGLAFRSDGEAVWCTTDGRVLGLRLERGQGSPRLIADLGGTSLTAPAVGADDTVYVGTGDGRLVALPLEAARWQAGAGAAVTLRPTVGHDGTVYVINTRGTLLALADGRGSARWRHELGQAASAPATVDGSRLYVAAGSSLRAVDLATGLGVWSLDLGGPTDGRAVPVLGPDRAIYLLRADQALVALREHGWLAAPSGVSVAATSESLSVRWRDTSQGETGFRVELCQRSDDCREVGRAAAGARSLALGRLSWGPGTVLEARVQALGAAGQDSGYGVSAPAEVPAPAPAAPEGFSAAAVASDAVALAWDYPGDRGLLQGFEIRRRGGTGSGFQTLAVVGADAQSFLDQGLPAAADQTYQLVALGAGGTTAPQETSARTWPRSLAAPSQLEVHTNGLVVQLDWRSNALGARGYRVERRDPGSAAYRVIGRLSGNQTRFYDAVYLQDGEYHYRIRAVGDEADSPWIGIGARVAAVERVTRTYLPFASSRRR